MNTLKNSTKKAEILASSGLIQSFSFDISPYVSIVSYEPEEYIFHDGERLTSLYFLLDGTVKLYIFHKNGKHSLIDFYSTSCVFGESEFLDSLKTAKPLQALSCCTFIQIDTSRCRDILLNDPIFLRFLCGLMTQKRIYQSKKYVNLVSYPSRNNLANYLLMTEQNDICKEKHTETADYLGISYRHLLYLISEYCKRGILEHSPQGLKIINYDILKKEASEIEDNPSF